MMRSFKSIQSSILITLSALSIASCTPSFETTAERCVSSFPLVLSVDKTDDNTEFQVLANRTDNNYKLYLEDALNSFLNAQAKEGDTLSPLSADQQAAIDFLLNDIAFEKLGYRMESGLVVSASNPLDYLESLLVATDPDEVVNSFESAKESIAAAVEKKTDFCNYSNSAITLQVEDPDVPASVGNILQTIRARLNLYFNPFDKEAPETISQTFSMSTSNTGSFSSIDDIENSITGVTNMNTSDYVSTGMSPVDFRTLNLTPNEDEPIINFRDVFLDSKLATFDITLTNSTCYETNENGTLVRVNGRLVRTVCTDEPAPLTRDPAHIRCAGGEDSEGNAYPDETGTEKVFNFDVVEGNDLLTSIQRLRIDIDFDANEIKYFASKFRNAVLKAGVDPDSLDLAEDVIYNPTDCEVNAVKEDMFALLTVEEQAETEVDDIEIVEYLDPYYDETFITNDDGEEEPDFVPSPIFTFQGTANPDRL